MTKRTWLRAVLIGGVFLLIASAGFSRALRASAARRYLIAHLAASFGRPVEVSWFDFSLLDGARIEAPTGVAMFPGEMIRPPREWAERAYNIRRWTAMPSGGHFAAMEEPAALAAEIRAFFRDLK